MGYQTVLQRDRHVQFTFKTPTGDHFNCPMHDEITPGTLNDILARVALWNGIYTDELIRQPGKRQFPAHWCEISHRYSDATDPYGEYRFRYRSNVFRSSVSFP